MTGRSLIGVAAAIALLSFGQSSPGGFIDLETEDRVRRARRERDQVSEARQERIRERRRLWETAEGERKRHAAEELAQLRAGIEPSTGRPLSRQRRRSLTRYGFKFDGANG